MSNKSQHPVPMNVANIPRSFGPNDAQAIVNYLQKRVRLESLDEAQAVTTLVASFVAFMNAFFDQQAAKSQGVVGVATVAPTGQTEKAANE
jgi:hypothetical protein